jgi:hypothetical protein
MRSEKRGAASTATLGTNAATDCRPFKRLELRDLLASHEPPKHVTITTQLPPIVNSKRPIITPNRNHTQVFVE